MKKVITYGTYDLLHHGHIRLLERAKSLGDYLIVGVTSEDFDKKRGKINVQQSLMERIQAVKATGLADEIIVEEYEGQKIDDIIKFGIDIFTVGSDWKGKFDYLKEYCEVIYLDRTEGISSTELRNSSKPLIMGATGIPALIKKYLNEVNYVNSLELKYVYISNEYRDEKNSFFKECDVKILNTFEELLEHVDAVYISDHPKYHYKFIEKALKQGKHVLYEPPLTLEITKYDELINLAKNNNLILMDASKTLYSQAYNRLILMAKSGAIGKIVSVESTCTSTEQFDSLGDEIVNFQNSFCGWGPIALLPVFNLLGTSYKEKKITTFVRKDNIEFDLYTKIDFEYGNSIATVKFGKCIKSENELLVTGTKGYIYVPSPWWKTDYFEIRSEKQNDTKRYFYNLDGEGIRYELVSFVKAIKTGRINYLSNDDTARSIVKLVEDFYNHKVNSITIDL